MVKAKHARVKEAMDAFIASGRSLPKSENVLKYSVLKNEKSLKQFLMAMSKDGSGYSAKSTNPFQPRFCLIDEKENKKKSNIMLAQSFEPVYYPTDIPDPRSQYRHFKNVLQNKARMKAASRRVELDSTFEKSLVENTLKETKKSNDPLEMVEALDRGSCPFSSTTILPPQNPKATSPDQVYDLEDVVPKKILKLYKAKAMELKEALETNLDGVRDRIPALFKPILPQLHNDNKNHGYKLLVHYAHLCMMAKIKNLKNTDEFLPEVENEDVKDFFQRKYLTRRKNGWFVNNQQKDMITVHTLIVALYATNNFTVPLQELKDDLGSTVYKLNKLARAVGCHVTRIVAKLSLPLFKQNTTTPGRAISKL